MTEGKEPVHLGKTPDDELQKMPHAKARNSTPTDTRTHTLAFLAGKESRRANQYTTRHPNMYKEYRGSVR